ncbi:DUF916 and DUF3324 domain-containing protein [Tetragenococcus osmophilus]|uniref:Cell wall surface anchor protein n=1 Tax=Tetragenococcus osmophilus TaxID=526944 RepID=A0AA38CYF2_9ENTE|nr:DUF916 and DUF3324 domain-containing protein [Tetragenococcus osmophilus]GMA72025.1 cell wall surface anchor protein [Tetragenococcus osmophilus]
MKKMLVLVFAFVFLLCFSKTGRAASEFDFSVHFDLPKNQVSSNKTYLDLLVQPNSTQNITYTLKNDTDKKIDVSVKVHEASTNTNGVVEYAKKADFKDSSLNNKMSDLVTYEKKVSIPANSSVEKQITVNIPKEKFDGVIAGGITFQEINEEDKEVKKGVGVESTFSMTKAILLRNNKKSISPELQLKEVSPITLNSRSVIQAVIQNDRPAYIFQGKFDTRIQKKNSNKILYQKKTKDISVAPNSTFGYQIPLEGKKLKPGEYQLTILAKGEKRNGNYKRILRYPKKMPKT